MCLNLFFRWATFSDIHAPNVTAWRTVTFPATQPNTGFRVERHMTVNTCCFPLNHWPWHKETNGEQNHKLCLFPQPGWRQSCYLTISLASCLTEGTHRILYRAPFTYGRIWGKQSDTHRQTNTRRCYDLWPNSNSLRGSAIAGKHGE